MNEYQRHTFHQPPRRGRAGRSGRGNRRRRQQLRRRLLLGTGSAVLGLAAMIAAARFFAKSENGSEPDASTSTELTLSANQAITVNGISLTGMTRAEARSLLLAKYPWKLSVRCKGETTALDDLIAPEVDALLDRIYTDDRGGDYTFSPTASGALKTELETAVAALAKTWDQPAQSSVMNGYDAANDRFTFSDGKNGSVIDQTTLVSDLLQAVESNRLDAVVDAKFVETAPKLSAEAARNQYERLASFTTETTNNAKRNTNVRLSAEALNGTIVQPGEEFSFNKTIGARTAEKGYQVAAAYNDGAVVQEVGGGVCQISSTLYHTAFQAGMKITYRRSHTFEPNYVTPGQDATISWEMPDFRFVNTSDAPIGIRASYADRKATVAIFGVPVLPKGETWDLESEKVEELPPPEAEYVEDQTLEPGKEVVEKSGTAGSRWVTYKVVKRDGKLVSREKDHEKTYKGHAPVIRRNTSGVKLTPDETTAAPKETVPETVDGMPDGYVPETDPALAETNAASNQHNGGNSSTETKAAADSTTSAETSAAPTENANAPAGTSPVGLSPAETPGGNLSEEPQASPAG